MECVMRRIVILSLPICLAFCWLVEVAHEILVKKGSSGGCGGSNLCTTD